MTQGPPTKIAHPAKRAICAFLALGGVATFIVAVVDFTVTGRSLLATEILLLALAFRGFCVFGLYAVKGHA
jgi:hypothetical protein